MFRKRTHRDAEPSPDPAQAYVGLRNLVLDLDPAAAGMEQTPDSGPVWGVVVETGYPNGVATLVCLRDGTSSLYLSSGGGTIGGGAHAAVLRANAALLAEATACLPQFRTGEDRTLPEPGRVILRALTYDVPRFFEASEDDLGYRRSVLAPVFHAAHAVITELRLLQQP